MPDQTPNGPEPLGGRSEQREGRLWRIWTTEPKLLIGLAALLGAITAIVSLFVSAQRDSPQEVLAPATTSESVATEATDNSAPSLTSDTSNVSNFSPSFTRELTLPPPPDALSYSSINVVAGTVSGSGAGVDEVYYEVSEGGKRRLTFSTPAALLSNQESEGVGREECAGAIQSSPLSEREPVRQLTKGTLICVTGSDDGVALIEVLAPPDRRGALAVRETYWEP